MVLGKHETSSAQDTVLNNKLNFYKGANAAPIPSIRDIANQQDDNYAKTATQYGTNYFNIYDRHASDGAADDTYTSYTYNSKPVRNV